MNRDSVQALMAGGLGAVMLVPLAMHPYAGALLGWFLAVPLFWAAGGLGHKNGSVAAMVAVAAVGLLMGPVIGFAYGLFVVFPAWFTGRQLLLKRQTPQGQDDWYPSGEAFAKATVYYAALLVAILASWASSLDPSVTLYEAMGLQLEEAFPDLFSAGGEAVATTVAIIQAVGPGLAMTTMVCMCAASALIAQAVLVRQGRNVRPSLQAMAFDLPIRLGWLMVVTGLLALVVGGNIGYMAKNVFIVLMVPYFFLGLVVIHAYAAGHRQKGVILFGCYILMAVIGWFVILVAALGMFENWSGIRKRMQNRNSRGQGPDIGDNGSD